MASTLFGTHSGPRPATRPRAHPALKARRFAGMELCDRYAVAPMTRVSATEEARPSTASPQPRPARDIGFDGVGIGGRCPRSPGRSPGSP